MIRKPNFKLNWKYALGEIALIFIGISLAFGLQQFANAQNEIKKGKRLLESFKIEFESNQESIAEHAKATQADADLVRSYIELINSDSAQFLSDADITFMIERIGPNYYKSLSIAAYEDIINSGGLEFITDPVIRRNFFRYGVFLTEYKSRVQSSLDHWYKEVSTYYQTHADLSQMTIGGITFEFEGSTFKNDKDAFIKNREFTNILRTRLIWQLGVLGYIEREMEDIKRYNDQINDYLN